MEDKKEVKVNEGDRRDEQLELLENCGDCDNAGNCNVRHTLYVSSVNSQRYWNEDYFTRNDKGIVCRYSGSSLPKQQA